jgi:hypothetical protein
VGQHRVGGQHGVLVRSEGGQPVPHERAQRGQRLPPGHRELARPVLAGEPHVAGLFPGIQVPADLVVDVVFGGRLGWRHVQAALRRGLPVLVIEVPPAAGRVVPVHQHPQPHPGIAVEVLQQQPAPAAALGPGLEFVRTGGEPPRRQHLDPGQVPDEPVGGEAGRSADGQLPGLPPGLTQSLGVGITLNKKGLVAELGRPVPERRQHQVRPPPVHGAAGERRPRLDQEHRLMRFVQEVGSQLVSEQPPPRGHPF